MTDPAASAPDRSPAPRHGGDLDRATAIYGLPAGGWLDLSTGINPVIYPAPPVTADLLARLPDASGLAGLVAAARNTYGVPAGAAIVPTPGSEIALRLLARLAAPRTIAIVGPTYASHADAWHGAGHDVVMVRSATDIPDGATHAVVVNPNNPDGRRADRTALVDLAHRLHARGGWLLVDEAFGDLQPEGSVVADADSAPLIVLRSFGKFYGLPGLRLGFAIGDANVVAPLARLLGAWPVSAPAMAIGTAALNDAAWQTAARMHLRSDASRLRAMLASGGLDVVRGTDLFVLVGCDRAVKTHEALARQGVWTRVFDEMPTWLRIGLPAPDQFDRLERALRALP